ncbi:MAG: sensor histidine kinase [Gammaproteobacteria bacterium]
MTTSPATHRHSLHRDADVYGPLHGARRIALIYQLFVLLLTLLVCSLAIWRALESLADFEQAQRTLVTRSVDNAAAQLEVRISELQRTVTIFAEEEGSFLRHLLSATPAEKDEDHLAEKVSRFFPERVAFALAEPGGNVIIEDIDGLVGNACRVDIMHFSIGTKQQAAYLHPNPLAPHFDIMSAVEHAGRKIGTFFISFPTTPLVDTLRLSQLPGHTMYLLRKDIPGLIELTADGTRLDRGADTHLSVQSLRAVLYSRDVEGTLWRVVDIPDANLAADHAFSVWIQAALICLAIALTGMVTLVLVRRQENRRLLLEADNRRLAAFPTENPNPVVALDAHGGILFTNPATQRILRDLNLVESELLPADFVILAEDAMTMGSEIRDLLVRVRDRVLTWEIHPIPSLGISYLYATDITDKIQAEEQAAQHLAELAHAGRLSTMGEMATGLAHELNQPLAAIQNYLHGSILRLKRDDLEAVLPALENAREQAARAGKIIQRLRELVRRQDPKRTEINLNDLVDGVLELLRRDIKRNEIHLTPVLDPELPLIRADRIQVEQVILNLVRNATEAVQARPEEERHIAITTGPCPKGVYLAVEDNGQGLPDDDLDQVFAAFFTTKREGMGMGLSISRTIIENHGGRLWAERSDEGNTRFEFTLPPIGAPNAKKQR